MGSLLPLVLSLFHAEFVDRNCCAMVFSPHIHSGSECNGHGGAPPPKKAYLVTASCPIASAPTLPMDEWQQLIVQQAPAMAQMQSLVPPCAISRAPPPPSHLTHVACCLLLLHQQQSAGDRKQLAGNRQHLAEFNLVSFTHKLLSGAHGLLQRPRRQHCDQVTLAPRHKCDATASAGLQVGFHSGNLLGVTCELGASGIAFFVAR